MPRRINLSEHTISVLSEMDTNFDQMNNLMQDLALGRDIYDSESDKMISKAEANEKVLAFSRKVLNIKNPRDRKEVRRGFRDHGREWLDIIEDTAELVVSTGLNENEWFDDFVEKRTVGYGDRMDFYSEDETILSVAKAGESHHDHILQRIAPGQTVSIPTYRHVVKIGADINRYILGDVDWSKMIQAIGKAFVTQSQGEAFDALDNAVSKLPVTSPFIGTGVLSATTKDEFDTKLYNVSKANEGVSVGIMGTIPALKKIRGMAEVDWASAAQKDAFATTGIIGTYEGTPLIPVTNRFKDKTMSSSVFREDKLFFMPMVDNKIVKFVDEGDTEINEVTEKGEQNGRWDDIMTYEVQRRYGVGVLIGRYFGQWTIA